MKASRGWVGAAALLLALGVSSANAQDSPEEAPTVAPAPDVGLERLLQLPDSYATGGGGVEVSGANAEEWRERFVQADARIDSAKAELEKAQKAIEKSADGSQWNLSAPGVQAQNTKDSTTGLPLRQRLRRLREELDEAERDKRALEVEADIAGVPAEWRR